VRSAKAAAVLLVWAAVLCAPRQALAYSVLAHEANIDALWETSLRPLLARRYPRATRDEVARSRAFAYGGAVIQDLGYYPFGSHFFSNLVHYVRTGDFVEALRARRTTSTIRAALGALAHYSRQRRPPRSGQPRGRADVPEAAREFGNPSPTPTPVQPRHRRVLVRRGAGGERAYVSDMYQASSASGVEAGARARSRRLRDGDERVF
jgi:hypothetical protein